MVYYCRAWNGGEARSLREAFMTRKKLYLALMAAVCAALAAYFALAAIGIWREGSARRAEDPMASVYTPQAVAGKLARVSPLVIAGAGLLVAGLALGVKDDGADRPAKDALLERDLLARRVARPSADMLAQRRRQRGLAWLGRGLFALCMVPILLHLTDPAHFPEDDPEGMLRALLPVLVPWTAAGLGALAATSVLREKSALLEARAARERLKQERAEGAPALPVCADAPGRAALPRAVIIAVAVILIVAGALNGSARDVLYKAITICTECVGLG